MRTDQVHLPSGRREAVRHDEREGRRDHRASQGEREGSDSVPQCVNPSHDKSLLRTILANRDLKDRRFDSDFRTLEHLVRNGALGDVREADLHFDFPNASWVYGWTQKEYVPGQGMTFALGELT